MRYLRFIVVISIFLIFFAGCAGPFIQMSLLVEESYNYKKFSSKDLAKGKLGFLPAAVPLGHEHYQIVIVNTLSKVFLEYNPNIVIVSPAEGINMVNANNLTKDFISIVKDYQVTGILDKNILKEIGNVMGANYLIQARLVRFVQDKSARLGVFGLRVIETRESSIEMIIQIWDPKNGLIVWEGTGNATMASEAFRAKGITFGEITVLLSKKILEKLPEKS